MTAVLLGSIGFGVQVGTQDHPIRMLLFPTSSLKIFEERANEVAEFLCQHTGLSIKVELQTSSLVMMQTVAESEKDTLAVLSSSQYVWVNEWTGGEAVCRTVGVRFASPYSYIGIYVRKESGLDFAGLNGKVWARCTDNPIYSTVLPNLLFLEEKISPSEILDFPGYLEMMESLMERQSDFATGYVLTNFDSDSRDLRYLLFPEYGRDVVLNEIDLLAITGPIPNEGLVFGPSFSPEMADRIVEALKLQLRTAEGEELWDWDFYYWTSVFEPEDDSYQFLEKLLGISS